MKTPTGEPLLLGTNPWKDTPYLPLALNPTNSVGLSEQAIYDAALRALRQWTATSNVSFDYWQGTDPEVYSLDFAYDGLSTIVFASASPAAAAQVNGSAAGYTQLWWEEGKAELIEADIILNDLDFVITDDPSEVDYSANARVLLLDDVLTHELGHAFGLDHAGNVSSTMLPWPWFGQASLHCDDLHTLDRLYGSEDGASGTVLDPDGRPIEGALVSLYGLRHGTLLESTFTEADGTFVLGTDAPGVLMVEPWLAGEALLSPDAYVLQHGVCVGFPFARTPWTTDGSMTVVSGEALGTLTVSCTDNGGIPSTLTGSPRQNDAPLAEPAWIDEVAFGTRYYDLASFQGQVTISAVAFGLHSGATVSHLAVVDQWKQVLAEANTPLVKTDEGYHNPDLQLTAALTGDEWLQVTTSSGMVLPDSRLLDPADAFLVMISEEAPPEQPECVLEVEGGDYTPPEETPRRWDAVSEEGRRCGCGGGGAWLVFPLMLWARKRYEY